MKTTHRIAVVTGAARGIGLATAKLFLEDGYEVLMVDRDASELEKAAAHLEHVHAWAYDISKPEDIADLAREAQRRYGRIDALVNNAGVADFRPLEDTTYDIWRRVMATNLDGVFLTTQALLPLLKVAKGAIVNIASISGLRASTLRVAYGTSKAAVIHLTQQQAAELGEYGIRANCVAPGPVDTKLALAVHTPEIRAAYHDAVPLNRYGSEREIAEMIVFLCSDKSSYVTGQVVAVDGGFQSTGVGLPALRNIKA